MANINKIDGWGSHNYESDGNYSDIENIFDRLEFAPIEVSPLGVTILGMTERDWFLLRAMFGRNNGYADFKSKMPVVVNIIDETIYDKVPKKTFLEKLKDLFKP